ncbi:MAG: serine/threonine-protein phosphatase [Desulfobacteraceae bacterium]|nr:serine/threonine-protein phosphatase [Desulfobacteraceae bacterium]
MFCPSNHMILMAVADGLGGEPGGEIASEHVIKQLKQLPSLNDKKLDEYMVSFFKKMDQDLDDMAKNNCQLDGMATTLISMVIKDNVAHWCHSGDSRIYHLRKDRITQITQDQTFARFLIQEGELTQEQAKNHYSRNVIDQCIGCQDLEPETGQVYLDSNDILILASDGLYRYVTQEEIYQVCCQYKDPAQAAEKLIKRSLNEGGKDNITVVIAKIH